MIFGPKLLGKIWIGSKFSKTCGSFFWSTFVSFARRYIRIPLRNEWSRDRISLFGPPLNCLKTRFSSSNKWKWIKSRFSNSLSITWSLLEFRFGPLLFELDQKQVEQIEGGFISKKNSSGSKVKRHVYASRNYHLKILNWIKNYTHAFLCATKLPKSVTQTL